MRRSILIPAFLLLLPTAATAAGAVLSAVPKAIDPRGDYLIYLHGRIIEEEGPRPTSPRFGVYEYRQILDTFAGRGFTVVSEAPQPVLSLDDAAVHPLLRGGQEGVRLSP